MLALVGEHLTNQQIAARLFISVRTVESHVSSLLRKLGVADRRALAELAGDRRTPRRSTRHCLPSALPTPLTSFVGRAAERAALAGALTGHRLVTAVGPGGVGKTRLALAVAEDVRSSTRAVPGTSTWCRSPTRRWSAPRWRTPSGSGSSRGGRPRTRWSPSSPAPRCCWCWTTASTCWTGSAPSSSGCWPPARASRAGHQPGPAAGAVRVRVPGARACRSRVTTERTRTRATRRRCSSSAPRWRAGRRRTRTTGAGSRRICRRLDGIALAIELAAARVATFGLDGLDRGWPTRWAC